MTTLVDYEGAAWELTKEQQKFFDEMEKELDLPITVVCGKGQRKDRSEDLEGIVIFDYATNSESPAPRRVDYISRRDKSTVKLDNTYLLKPDDQREHIFDFNGFPLCEIRLYTLWSLTPLQNFQTEALMKEFWSDALRMSCKEDFFRHKEEEKQRKIREAFLEAMKAANEVEVTNQEKQIESHSSKLAQLNQEVVAATSAIFRAERQLEIAKQITEGDQSTYESEIASLMKHNQIKKIDYDTASGTLEIYTTLLYLVSPDKKERVPLGEFLIKVATKSNNVVSLHNLTNKKSSKMHPHVDGNGHPCWGAISPQIAKLAASCKIEGLADLCIRYLETYNVQDANATYARYWFIDKDIQKKRSDLDDQWFTEEEYKEALKSKKSMDKKEEVKETETKAQITEEKVTDKTLEEIKS